MINKIKKNFFVLAFAFFFALSFGCVKEKKQDISLTKFSANSEKYTHSDKADLTIMLKNYKNYEVTSYKINDKIVAVDLENTELFDSFTYSADLKEGQNVFILKEIKYKINDKEFTLKLEEKIEIYKYPKGTSEETYPTVKNITLTTDKTAYELGESITFKIEFDNPKNREIKALTINNESVVLPNDTTTQFEYTTTLKDNSGQISISGITFLDGMKKCNINYKNISSLKFDVKTSGPKPKTFILLNDDGSIKTDSENNYLLTKKERLNFKMKVSINDLEDTELKQINLKINDELVKIEKFKLDTDSSNFAYQFYYFDFAFANSNRNIQKVKLYSVGYVNKDSITSDNKGDTSGKSEIQVWQNIFNESKTYSFKVYDKVIKTYEDFLTINDDLSGNYILANNINANQKDGNIIGRFNGMLDGNGYAIDFNAVYLNGSVFETLSSESIIKNIHFQNMQFSFRNSNQVTASCIAEECRGEITAVSFNIKSAQKLGQKETSELYLLSKINDGAITDIEISTNDIETNGKLYLTFKENCGTINRIILSTGIIKKISEDGIDSIYFLSEKCKENSILANTLIHYEYFTFDTSKVGKAKIFLTPINDNVSLSATITGNYYDANFKTKTNYYKIDKKTLKLVSSGEAYEWHDENSTEISTADYTTEKFFYSALKFNQIGKVYWYIKDGSVAFLK